MCGILDNGLDFVCNETEVFKREFTLGLLCGHDYYVVDIHSGILILMIPMTIVFENA